VSDLNTIFSNISESLSIIGVCVCQI